MLKISLGNLRPQKHLVFRILTFGLPVFLIEAISSVQAVLFNNSLGVYHSDLAISGIGIVNSIIMLILMPIFGINLGAQPITGYIFGAGNRRWVKQALLLTIAADTSVVTIGFVGCQLFAEALIMTSAQIINIIVNEHFDSLLIMSALEKPNCCLTIMSDSAKTVHLPAIRTSSVADRAISLNISMGIFRRSA